MKALLAIITLALTAFLGSSTASAERLVTSISRHQVMVTSSFTGTTIVLFGTIEPDSPASRNRFSGYDLVVTVTGPRHTTVARRKERMMGIWTNTASRTFINVPRYLAVLSTRPSDQFTSAELIQTLQLGIDSILLPQQFGQDIGDPGRNDPFRANFVRLKTEQQLYQQVANGVTLLTPSVFRAEIPLPAVTPFGNYDVDIKVFADRLMVSRGTSAFEIVKVGFEQFVTSAARDQGLLYGLTTAILAVFTGWFAAVIFRRD
jgi:uncharacterized protein (TIGR02186 family)